MEIEQKIISLEIERTRLYEINPKGPELKPALYKTFELIAQYYREYPREFLFYAPYGLRCFLASSHFTKTEMSLANDLYAAIEHAPVEHCIDIHIYWLRLHGHTIRFDEIMADMYKKESLSQLGDVSHNLFHSTLNSITSQEINTKERLMYDTQTSWGKFDWLSHITQNAQHIFRER